MTVIGWVDSGDIAERYPWAQQVLPEDLEDALAASYEQCLAFVNGRDPLDARDADGQPVGVPKRYELAQVKQARALIRADYAGDGGTQLGPDDMPVTVFPMDWTVKALLRPRKGARGPR